MVEAMTAPEVIEEIKRLPRPERVKVIEFARSEADPDQLSAAELVELARRMVEAPTEEEADRLQAELKRGFYGNEPHA